MYIDLVGASVGIPPGDLGFLLLVSPVVANQQRKLTGNEVAHQRVIDLLESLAVCDNPAEAARILDDISAYLLLFRACPYCSGSGCIHCDSWPANRRLFMEIRVKLGSLAVSRPQR